MPNSSPPSEQRRRFSRVLFTASAHLQVDGRDQPCEVHDLSLKGALLRLGGPSPAPGTACTLRLQLDEHDMQIEMLATVSHAKGSSVGLRCESIDLDSVSHLRRLVELNVGDESILQRDLSSLIALD